ncbi:MAG TPA: hypothetical protein VF172_12720 [Nitrososphaera sp.]
MVEGQEQLTGEPKAKGYGTARPGSHLTKTSEGAASSEETKESGAKEPPDIK